MGANNSKQEDDIVESKTIVRTRSMVRADSETQMSIAERVKSRRQSRGQRRVYPDHGAKSLR